MEDLGFRPPTLAAFKRMLREPHGLVLVTGPTGSGKTTTLYSGLELLRSPEKNIVTVEDPVEYQLDMINQIQVNESIGMTFARALRSILRQDPDIIMVGEIRDEQTARVAVQAALTGHLVLATLHTNDAPGAVSRIMDMGIEPYLLSSALNGVLAQRLARTVCPHCATKYYPSENVLADAGLADSKNRVFRKGVGCRKCHNSGFLGRIGIFELMEVTPEIRSLIHHAAASHEIRRKMRADGVLSLRDEAILAAIEGKTALEEALCVARSEEPAKRSTEADQGQSTVGMRQDGQRGKRRHRRRQSCKRLRGDSSQRAVPDRHGAGQGSLDRIAGSLDAQVPHEAIERTGRADKATGGPYSIRHASCRGPRSTGEAGFVADLARCDPPRQGTP